MEGLPMCLEAEPGPNHRQGLAALGPGPGSDPSPIEAGNLSILPYSHLFTKQFTSRFKCHRGVKERMVVSLTRSWKYMHSYGLYIHVY